jgi:hypothetical protein
VLPNSNVHEVICEMDPTIRKIDEVDVKLVDRYGKLLVFGDG